MDAASRPDSIHRKRLRTASPSHTMTLQADPATALPPETFLHILSFLQPPALLRCSRVSQTWREVCTDEALWRALSLRWATVSWIVGSRSSRAVSLSSRAYYSISIRPLTQLRDWICCAPP